MAGRFISTTYSDTVKGVTDINKATLNQDFYYLNSQGKGTKVTFFNINKEKSSLDPGSHLAYADIGDESPIRFDKINNVFLYQFNRNETNFNNDEFGLESAEITGESYILPNTFEPIDGSFFIVDHSNDKFLYKVTDVDRDTLSNGHNAWKFTWHLDRVTDKEILKNVVGEYEYYDAVSGNNLKPVVESTKFKKALELENILESLSEYFKDIFFSDKVQTFIYKWYNEANMYDPYAIEFIMRNRLLANASEYTYVNHACRLPKTFAYDYMSTIYHVIEEKKIDNIFGSKRTAQANLINDPTSLFSTRYEHYFALDYNVILEPNGPYNPRGIIPIMKDEMVERITRKLFYRPEDKEHAYRNIFVKYFNNMEILKEDIDSLDGMRFEFTNECFYETLFMIYILQDLEKQLLS